MKRRRKRHNAALANSRTVYLLERLKSGWKDLSRIERGRRLQELTGLGRSVRGLADALGGGHTSIVRYIETAQLESTEMDMIEKGHSAKKLLAKRGAERGFQRYRGNSKTPLGGLPSTAIPMADAIKDSQNAAFEIRLSSSANLCCLDIGILGSSVP